MVARARGLDVHKRIAKYNGLVRAVATLSDGTPYAPDMRVQHAAMGSLGTIAWVTWREDAWEAVVAWDGRDTWQPTLPPGRVVLNALISVDP